MRKSMKTGLELRERTRLSIRVGIVVFVGLSAFLMASYGLVMLRIKQPIRPKQMLIELPDGTTRVAQKKQQESKFVPGQLLVKFKKDADVLQVTMAALATSAHQVVVDAQQRPVVDAVLRNELARHPVDGYKLTTVQPTLKNIKPLRSTGVPGELEVTKSTFERKTTGAEFRLDRWRTIEVNEQTVDVLQLVNAFAANKYVEAAEPNRIVHKIYLPNDYYYNTDLQIPPVHSWGQSYPDMWGLKRIDTETAWNIGQGNPGVTVAVVDTGLTITHPDIAANVWVNRAEDTNGNCVLDAGEDRNHNGVLDSGETCNGRESNGFDDDGNGYRDDVRGANVVLDNGMVADTEGHGTHVSGTIAGVMGNSIGVTGVCGHCRVMPIVAIPGGAGSNADVVEGILYAVNNGAKVINISAGGEGFSQVLEDAVNVAHARDVVVVAGAGNNNSNTPFYPAASEQAIAVTAIDHNDTRPGFSNFGDWVDVTAPGVSILSLKAQEAGTMCPYAVGSLYCLADGTSMATPHVTGLAGLVRSYQPGLTADQVRDVIELSAENIFEPGFDIHSGWGLIDASAALNVASDILQHPKAELLARGVTVSINWQNTVTIAGMLLNRGQVSTGSSVGYRITDHFNANVASGTTPSALLPGGTFQFSVTFPGSFGETYTLTIDPTNTVAEYNEGNNVDLTTSQLASLPGWPQVVGPMHSAPTVADLDRDGQPEVVAANEGGVIHVLRADGTKDPGHWPVHTRYLDLPYNWGEPVVADFDPTTPGLEVLYINDYGEFHALSKDGDEIPGWPRRPVPEPGLDTTGSTTRPTVADINGDGILELLGSVTTDHWATGGSDGNIVVQRFDGTPVPGWEIPYKTLPGVPIYSSPTVADVRPDLPGLEIFVGAKDGKVYAWRADGTPLPGWPKLTATGNYIKYAAVAVADVDPTSPGLEVFVPATNQSTSSASMYAWRADGTPLPGWPKQLFVSGGTEYCHEPVIADIDTLYPGLEVVGSCVNGYMTAWHADGVPVTGWNPVMNIAPEQILGRPAVADLDGDGHLEIIIGNTSNNRLIILRWNAQPFTSLPITLPTNYGTTPVVDLNGDGVLELIAASGEGTVYAWPMQSPSTVSAAPWPMSHHDPYNTGNFTFTTPATPYLETTFDAPAAGIVLEGTATLEGHLVTSGYVVQSVEFTVEGGLTTHLPAVSTPCTRPGLSAATVCYTAQFNSTTVADGQYSIKMKATSTAGLVAMTPTVPVSIDNIYLTLKVLQPRAGSAVARSVTIEGVANMPVDPRVIAIFFDNWFIGTAEGVDLTTRLTLHYDFPLWVSELEQHSIRMGGCTPGNAFCANSEKVWFTIDKTAPSTPSNLTHGDITIGRAEPTPLKSGMGVASGQTERINGVLVAGEQIAKSELTPPDNGGGGGVKPRLVPLAWDASTDTGSGIAGYKVYFCYETTGCTPNIPVDVGNVTTYSAAAAVLGKTYVYEVTAYDRAGNESARSNRVTVTIYQ